MLHSDIYTDFYLSEKNRILHCYGANIAFIQYKSFRINLLTGEKINLSADYFLNELAKIKTHTSYSRPIVCHLFFEFGYIVNNLESKVDDNKILAIFIEYNNYEEQEITGCSDDEIFFDLLESISKKEYKKRFNKVYENLLSGNCYQLNLTQLFHFKLKQKNSPDSFTEKLWSSKSKIGAYAHATYIEPLERMYLSNSPECLYQVSGDKIRTMPIKGTLKRDDETKDKVAWEELDNSTKNESELNMITDLMRNDLTRIQKIPAKVLHKKFPLVVPGLIHQFSVIESSLKNKTNVKNIIGALFPGGSITGAPKKNVLKLIREIENVDRGFYCGSTLFIFRKINTASINIRSAEIDFVQGELKYGAGGGITLLSQVNDEYKESIEKLKSFLFIFMKKPL